MFSAFKKEIVVAEQGRTDLLKWKLILVAVLGSIGLGIDYSVPSNPDKIFGPYLVLCLIPLVCVYVDLLCKHLKLRILVISQFFQSERQNLNEEYQRELDSLVGDKIFVEYEKYCEINRGVFAFEDWVQQGSTYFLSILILVFPFLLRNTSSIELSWLDVVLFVSAGLSGIIFTKTIDHVFRRKVKSLKLNVNYATSES